jgi:TPR repeat protein
MSDLTTEKLLQAAEAALDSLGCEAAYKLLEPLLAARNPGALYLYSRFSIAEKESEKEFEMRSIRMLREAADAGYLPAVYSLAICHEVGDLVEADPGYAASLFKAAADKGYPKAKFRHGLNVYYGSNGVNQNTAQGLELIRAAAEEGVEDAIDFLSGQGRA